MHLNRLLLILTLALGSAAAWADSGDVAKARELAFNGHRSDAIQLLEKYLESDPDDTDALTVYGSVLSWEGKYPEARAALRRVLAKNPTHGDALPALINVELWSGNPTTAEELASRGLLAKPEDTNLQLARARALRKMGRLPEALQVTNKLAASNPGQSSIASLRDDLLSDMRNWEVSTNNSYEIYSDHRSGRMENQLSILRRTSIGSFDLRFSRTDQYGIHSHLAELDTYLSVREGTYLNINGGYSPDANLYARYRFGGEIFQGLPKGFEVSAGARRLGFKEPVHFFTGSVSKYYHSWMFTARTFITPGVEGDSHSYMFTARRYGGDGQSYFGFRYGFGRAPVLTGSLNEIETLGSRSYALESNLRFFQRLEWRMRAGYSDEDRLNLIGLKHYTLSSSLGYKF